MTVCVCLFERLINKTKDIRMKRSTITSSIIVRFFARNRTSRSSKFIFWEWITNPINQLEKEKELFNLWEDTSAELEPSVFKSLKQVKKKAGIIESASRFMHPQTLLRIASMIIIPLLTAVGAWWYVANYNQSIEMIECRIPLGEQKELILPDGTKVKLNSETFLLYPKTFRSDTRTVYLSGEANFNVTKDAKHPFIVKTAQLSIKALGTKFNVNANADFGKTTTVLEDGLVEITDMQHPSNSDILKPGEQLELDHYNRSFKKSSVNVYIATGWVRGELNFVNNSLKEIISSLERHFNIKIIADSQLNLSTDLYTIKIKKGESLKKIFNIIALTVGGIKVEYVSDDTVKIIKSNEQKKKGGE